MSGPKRFLLVVFLLLVTNGLTGGYLTYLSWNARNESEQALEQKNRQVLELRQKLADSRSELDSLSTWSSFIQMQQDLNAINQEINELNFGLALGHVVELEKAVGSGDLGLQFSAEKDRLLPLLDECRRALVGKSETARVYLVEFNQRAFEILSGISPLGREPEAEPETWEEAQPQELPQDEVSEESSGEGQGHDA
jgi:hypothetical protein